jgi:RNA polymerase sigma-70 factor (ECF subfamily)
MELILENDTEILNAYAIGKTDFAINSFVRKYQKFVYATAYRYLQDYDEADDAAQEVFIKAINSLSKFQNKSSLKTWLYKITRNHCQNLIARNKFKNVFRINSANDEGFDLVSNSAKPDEIIEGKELLEKFNRVISKLPEKQRETFILRHYEEMPYEEISNLLGTSVGGLKANYFQAVKKITEEFKKEL